MLGAAAATATATSNDDRDKAADARTDELAALVQSGLKAHRLGASPHVQLFDRAFHLQLLPPLAARLAAWLAEQRDHRDAILLVREHSSVELCGPHITISAAMLRSSNGDAILQAVVLDGAAALASSCLSSTKYAPANACTDGLTELTDDDIDMAGSAFGR